MLPYTRFTIIGPQGSGKGTQAKFLAERLGVRHVSTGDMFRHHVSQGTELGKQVDVLLKAGSLVPDEVTNMMITERLVKPDVAPGFVLDGYPRNVVQAEFLGTIALEVQAIELQLTDAEAVRRIAGRRVCQKCGANFHLEFAPPRVADACDSCGGELVQRADDTEAAVRARLATYHRETEPLLTYYRSRGTLTVVDGAPPIPKVTAAVRIALGL